MSEAQLAALSPFTTSQILQSDAFADLDDPTQTRVVAQILFRRDAPEQFDEAYPYGRRPEVELLAHEGVSPYRSLMPGLVGNSREVAS